MIGFDLTEEQEQLSQTAREFTRKEIVPVAGQLDEEGEFPTAICKKAWETGLMNCEIPRGLRRARAVAASTHCLVLEEISYGCTGINTTMAGNMLGAMPLILAGTDEQKKKYFGRLLRRADLRRLLLLRARRRLRRRRHEDAATARWATTTSHRPEALDHQRRRRQLLHRVRPRRRDRAPQGHHLLRRRRGHARASRSARRRTRWGSAARTPPT